MLDIKKRTKIILVFSLFLGIYQYKMFATDSILLSLIGGIEIGQPGDVLPYIEIVKWMFTISFLILLSVMQLKEKAKLYIYEITRYRSYRYWCIQVYKKLFVYTLNNALMCIGIWYLMDLIIKKHFFFPPMAVVLFVFHLWCCMAVIVLMDTLFTRNELVYLPLIIEGGTLLIACKLNTGGIPFWGTWGMYNRSCSMNRYAGFSGNAVIVLETIIILLSCLISSKGEKYNEVVHKDL